MRVGNVAVALGPGRHAFVGNVDDSVESIVNSYDHDLFKPLHPVFDLAILDRFHTYVPGWEIPKNRDENLARNYGLIIEYLAESFHHLSRKTNRFAYVKSACKLGKGYDQRDQTAVLKTVCAFLKMLHPGTDPSTEERGRRVPGICHRRPTTSQRAAEQAKA